MDFPGASSDTKKVKLTTTGVTDIVAPSPGGQKVVSINVAEIAGGVALITLEIYDGTTSFYICKSMQMSANRCQLFDQGWSLNPGEKIRATASIANNLDIIADVLIQSPGLTA